FAADLVEQIGQLRNGHYLDELANSRAIDFGVGVAGYPEKHFESPNLKQDVEHLKQKIDRGSDYIMTQMFFDNKHFFNFQKLCLEEGIKAPIIPGLKVISKLAQLKSIPGHFHIDLPDELVMEINASPQH